MKNQCRTLCLILKQNIICEKCGISLNKRLYRKRRVAFSLNSKTNSGFICIHCVLNSKNKSVYYQTVKEVNRFLKEKIGVMK